MEKKLTTKQSLLLASMLFGMFFGAGNLIFPAQLGQLAGKNFVLATAGFCLTGVGLPLLGIAAMGISRSEGLFDMGLKVNRAFSYFFTCALYLSIGPLFAVPRTATVSYAVGIAPFLPEQYRTIGLAVFSFLFFCVVLFFALRPSGILIWVGKVLNPIFLVSLAILLVMAIVNPMGSPASAVPAGAYASKAFSVGLLEGYNTLDALASLAFGIVLIDSIRRFGITDPTSISFHTIKSGTLAVILMAVIYGCLAYAGAQSVEQFGILEDGGAVLHHLSDYYFSTNGAFLLGIIITFACLKTSVGLVTSCSETFSKLFRQSFSYRTYAICFSLFSFGIANLGLDKIIKFSIPVLLCLYPITIVLIFLCLFGRFFNYHKAVFRWTVFSTCAAAVLEFVQALPSDIQAVIPMWSVVSGWYKNMPLGNYGMGWISFTAVGLGCGIIAAAMSGKAKKAS